MFFNMSFMGKADKIEGHIVFDHHPWGLGFHRDINGKRWHIGAIVGKSVCAVPADEVHPYYSDTTGRSFGLVQQTWKPYTYEVVKK